MSPHLFTDSLSKRSPLTLRNTGCSSQAGPFPLDTVTFLEKWKALLCRKRTRFVASFCFRRSVYPISDTMPVTILRVKAVGKGMFPGLVSSVNTKQ
ncbi:hypothetical protein F7725_002582 [Dissostichus mawsoni]|uniref:Uncharacterized protein n=1 Tax=Dissostichus mawsoni TaxID=36200 RepID=A0A7J5Y3S5_DISMA|nr:hypothetical protein F7725_002582 [Dissostichus mawsoni]